MSTGRSALRLSAEVAAALADNTAIVALESTIVSHGLPWPANLEAAQEFEELVRSSGAVPATIAVIDGAPTIGLEAAELERVAEGGEGMSKASVRDLPVLAALGGSAGTTVAATAFLAALAGIRVFATGGLGGVHRGAAGSVEGAAPTYDESADLTTLGEVPVTVVSAGVKSVLDILATLERLETLSVPVVGFGTRAFPAFWLRESGYELDWAVDSASQVAAIMRERDALGLSAGILVANPVPAEQAWTRSEHDDVVTAAFAAAEAAGVRGKAVTPFLLGKIVELSGGRSLEVNLDLVRNNIRVAAAIATAWSESERESSSA